MYTCTIQFKTGRHSVDEYVDEIVIPFMAALYRNGRILNTVWNPVHSRGKIMVAGILPENDSLLGCSEADRFTRGIKTGGARVLFGIPNPIIGSWNACTCDNPGFYVLYTTFLADFPPVRCGDCGRPVPLYRFPKVGSEQDYDSILSWEREYQACDSLYIHSGAGEQFGLRQICDPESELSREGRAICEALSAGAGVPFFYYFFGPDDDNRSQCPLCGGKWTTHDDATYQLCYPCGLATC